MTPACPSPAAYRGRFAPSPTGPLHLGSLTAALGSWLLARHHRGEWLIRVEDLDPPRELAGMARQQIQTLARFGLLSDAQIVWQSKRSGFYSAALQQLIDAGLAFECRCSRADLADSGGIHRRCVANPSGLSPAWRVRVPDQTIGFDDAIRGRFEQSLGEDVGDIVVRRADGFWAYQLAVVVDDALQGITQVVRGADLIDSTPRQIFLQRALGLATPGYAHLPVIRQPGGDKLSKSLNDASLESGDPLPAIRRAYAWLGQDSGLIGDGIGVEQALGRALAAFEPELIPATDQFLRSG